MVEDFLEAFRIVMVASRLFDIQRSQSSVYVIQIVVEISLARVEASGIQEFFFENGPVDSASRFIRVVNASRYSISPGYGVFKVSYEFGSMARTYFLAIFDGGDQVFDVFLIEKHVRIHENQDIALRFPCPQIPRFSWSSVFLFEDFHVEFFRHFNGLVGTSVVNENRFEILKTLLFQAREAS